jgi:hypothetical protein
MARTDRCLSHKAHQITHSIMNYSQNAGNKLTMYHTVRKAVSKGQHGSLATGVGTGATEALVGVTHEHLSTRQHAYLLRRDINVWYLVVLTNNWDVCQHINRRDVARKYTDPAIALGIWANQAHCRMQAKPELPHTACFNWSKLRLKQVQNRQVQNRTCSTASVLPLRTHPFCFLRKAFTTSFTPRRMAFRLDALLQSFSTRLHSCK